MAKEVHRSRYSQSAPSGGLQAALFERKRLQARKAASDNESAGSASDVSITGESDNSSNGSSERDRSDARASSDQDSEESEDDPDGGPRTDAASISFGALAKAQEVLGKRKRSAAKSDSDEEPRPQRDPNTEFHSSEGLERKAGKKDHRDFSRASKHAPAELSSKKAVSRRREVVPSHKIVYRDPRFVSLSGPLDTEKTKRNYSFLETYRDDEINELKATIRKTKDPGAIEKLKHALLSMESRKKSQQAKDLQQEILRKHRKEEKGKIEQGKKPFYLKKADQKKLALTQRFEGMKEKQVEKVIERRRKKQAGKERRSMPDARRG